MKSRLREMIEQAGTGTELDLVTRLAAPQGTKFVFQFPELVRLLLQRGIDLEAASAIRGTLWLSARGGGRSSSADDVDPEYRHILTEAESLANRFRDDHLLNAFYRMIAESERIELPGLPGTRKSPICLRTSNRHQSDHEF